MPLAIYASAVLVVRQRPVPASDTARRHGSHELVAVSGPARLHATACRGGQLQRAVVVVVVDVARLRRSAALPQTTSGGARRRKGAARFRSEVRFSTRTQK